MGGWGLEGFGITIEPSWPNGYRDLDMNMKVCGGRWWWLGLGSYLFFFFLRKVKYFIAKKQKRIA